MSTENKLFAVPKNPNYHREEIENLQKSFSAPEGKGAATIKVINDLLQATWDFREKTNPAKVTNIVTTRTRALTGTPAMEKSAATAMNEALEKAIAALEATTDTQEKKALYDAIQYVGKSIEQRLSALDANSNEVGLLNFTTKEKLFKLIDPAPTISFTASGASDLGGIDMEAEIAKLQAAKQVAETLAEKSAENAPSQSTANPAETTTPPAATTTSVAENSAPARKETEKKLSQQDLAEKTMNEIADVTKNFLKDFLDPGVQAGFNAYFDKYPNEPLVQEFQAVFKEIVAYAEKFDNYSKSKPNTTNNFTDKVQSMINDLNVVLKESNMEILLKGTLLTRLQVLALSQYPYPSEVTAQKSYDGKQFTLGEVTSKPMQFFSKYNLLMREIKSHSQNYTANEFGKHKGTLEQLETAFQAKTQQWNDHQKIIVSKTNELKPLQGGNRIARTVRKLTANEEFEISSDLLNRQLLLLKQEVRDYDKESSSNLSSTKSEEMRKSFIENSEKLINAYSSKINQKLNRELKKYEPADIETMLNNMVALREINLLANNYGRGDEKINQTIRATCEAVKASTYTSQELKTAASTAEAQLSKLFADEKTEATVAVEKAAAPTPVEIEAKLDADIEAISGKNSYVSELEQEVKEKNITDEFDRFVEAEFQETSAKTTTETPPAPKTTTGFSSTISAPTLDPAMRMEINKIENLVFRHAFQQYLASKQPPATMEATQGSVAEKMNKLFDQQPVTRTKINEKYQQFLREISPAFKPEPNELRQIFTAALLADNPSPPVQPTIVDANTLAQKSAVELVQLQHQIATEINQFKNHQKLLQETYKNLETRAGNGDNPYAQARDILLLEEIKTNKIIAAQQSLQEKLGTLLEQKAKAPAALVTQTSTLTSTVEETEELKITWSAKPQEKSIPKLHMGNHRPQQIIGTHMKDNHFNIEEKPNAATNYAGKIMVYSDHIHCDFSGADELEKPEDKTKLEEETLKKAIETALKTFKNDKGEPVKIEDLKFEGNPTLEAKAKEVAEGMMKKQEKKETLAANSTAMTSSSDSLASNNNSDVKQPPTHTHS